MPRGDTTWFLTATERGNPATRIDAATEAGREPRAWSHGNHAQPLIHGAAYFRVLHDAIEHASDEDIEEICALADRLQAVWGTDKGASAIWALHARIALITPNELLRSLYTNLVDYIIAEQLEGATAPSTPERLRTHLDFAAAVAERNHELARSAAERHRHSSVATLLS